VLEKVGHQHNARTRVRPLSGGQKRRRDLALARFSPPQVVFHHEPTTGMDPEARRDTWDVIGNVRAAGTTVLLTTHYLEEAERLADHLAIMHEGVIHARGTVEEVVAEAGDRIVFRLPRLPRGGPPHLLDTAPEITRSGDGAAVTYTIDGSSPTVRAHAAMRSLLAWADGQDLTLERLEVRKGTLEDVFLRVVGDAR
jgi:ABC-2 type transport system ATP-binding protein